MSRRRKRDLALEVLQLADLRRFWADTTPRAPRGAAPGTLVGDPEAHATQIDLVAFDDDDLVERQNIGIDDIVAAQAEFPVVWVNVDGLGDLDLIKKIGELFGLHPLALEDVVHVHQRAKVEPYEDHLFVVIRMAMLMDGEIQIEQLSLFLGPGFVLTFGERPGDSFEPVRDRIRRSHGRIRRAPPDYLAYALIDAVVDGYFPLLERVGDRLEDLEVQVLVDPGPAVVQKIHAARQELLGLRRAAWPIRDAINSLIRDDFALIQPDTRVYLRDCYDHGVQIVDLVENYRELTSGLMDIYLSSVSHRMNEVMKVLTIIATIFIPLSFIAGVYGMNFETKHPANMPELNWAYGYPFALGLMSAVAGGLLVYFWRRGWLGNG